MLLRYWRPGFMLLAMVLGAIGTLRFMDAQDGAAWIQCIWSVIAVVLAIILPGWQTQVQAEGDYRRHKQLLRELVRMADDHFQVHVVNAVPPAAKGEAIQAALNSFPITVLLTAQEAQDLMAIRTYVNSAAHDVSRALSGSLAPQGLQGCFMAARAKAVGAMNRLTAKS